MAEHLCCPEQRRIQDFGGAISNISHEHQLSGTWKSTAETRSPRKNDRWDKCLKNRFFVASVFVNSPYPRWKNLGGGATPDRTPQHTPLTREQRMKTKGDRFTDQRSWIDVLTNETCNELMNLNSFMWVLLLIWHVRWLSNEIAQMSAAGVEEACCILHSYPALPASGKSSRHQSGDCGEQLLSRSLARCPHNKLRRFA